MTKEQSPDKGEKMADVTMNDVASTASIDAPAPSKPWQVALERFNQLSLPQKIAAGAALALAVAMLVGVWLWSKPAQYEVLFSNLEAQDGAAIVQHLQQQNVKYQLSNGGATILVPTGMAPELRLRLAAQGLPRNGNVGFELMDQQKIGITQFAEQVNYQRALEGELARSIAALGAVMQARVHLAIPKRTSFLRDKQKPTASVVVHLRPGRTLDEVQIAGIRHLIAASVPNMAPEDVAIVDQNGKLLTLPPEPLHSALNAKQLAFQQEIETQYRERIENLLAPVVGKSNFRAQVTVELDFDQIERTAETYRPNPAPQQAIRSQQIHEIFGAEALPQGVPGALTNQPPVPATAPITVPEVGANGPGSQPRRERAATINYELDRTIEHTKKSLGAVKKLAVAVVVNQKREKTKEGEIIIPSPEELAQLEQLVKSAVGFDPSRGDTISVNGVLFSTVVDEPTAAWWKKLLEDPEMVEIIRELLRFLLVIVALTIVYFGVLRPLLRAVMPPTKPETSPQDQTGPSASAGETGPSGTAAMGSAGAVLPEGAMGEHAIAFGAEGELPDALVSLTHLTPQDPFEEKLARLRELTQSNPKLMANLIKEWLGVEEKKKK